jgi:hypothetical protein
VTAGPLSPLLTCVCVCVLNKKEVVGGMGKRERGDSDSDTYCVP